MRSATTWGMVALACVALVGGCSTDAPRRDANARSNSHALGHVRDLHEQSMHRAWVGRASSELVADLGRPVAMLGMPGADRIPPSLILVYAKADSPGGCIDAFVVLLGENGPIWNYFCR